MCIEFPFLIRLNDRATGEDTYLINSMTELEMGLRKLESKPISRLGTTMMCIQFINTQINNHYVSYRIVVAGNKIISGYARLSKSWLAITSQFTEEMKEEFITQNQKVKTIIDNNYELIIKAVKSLGLHYQGIDILVSNTEQIYFLEVQPFYFSGRMGTTNPTTPPFWNPYKPKELVNWLIEEKKTLSKLIPFYYENWLDKENHFQLCYTALKEYF